MIAKPDGGGALANVHDVAALILECAGPIEAMKLEKLAYYSQAWHVAVTGQPLFDEPVEAWRDGPVVYELWDRHRQRRVLRQWDGAPGAVQGLSRDIVNLVCEQYRPLSGDELSELSHSEPPWNLARTGLASSARSRSIIHVEWMADYYRTHRTLGGRYAADLAAGGVHVRSTDHPGTFTPDERRHLLAAALDDDPSQFEDVVGFGQGLGETEPPPRGRRSTRSQAPVVAG
jgi:uncharacterized phage-associated protein